MSAPSTVIFVEKNSKGKITCETIDTSTQKKNPSNVMNAVKDLVSRGPWPSIEFSTWKNPFTDALFVSDALKGGPT